MLLCNAPILHSCPSESPVLAKLVQDRSIARPTHASQNAGQEAAARSLGKPRGISSMRGPLFLAKRFEQIGASNEQMQGTE